MSKIPVHKTLRLQKNNTTMAMRGPILVKTPHLQRGCGGLSFGIIVLVPLIEFSISDSQRHGSSMMWRVDEN